MSIKEGAPDIKEGADAGVSKCPMGEGTGKGEITTNAAGRGAVSQAAAMITWEVAVGVLRVRFCKGCRWGKVFKMN